MGQAPSQQYHHSRTDPLGILSSQEENDFLNEVKITRSQGLTNFEGSRLHKLLREDPSLVLSQGMQHMSIQYLPQTNQRLVPHCDDSTYPGNGWNALTVAVYESPPLYGRDTDARCNLELVQYLVNAGVDPNARNNTGATPLSGALERNLPEVIADYLAREGADPQVTDNCGYGLEEKFGIGKRRYNKLLSNFKVFQKYGPQLPRAYWPHSQPHELGPALSQAAVAQGATCTGGMDAEMFRIQMALMLGGPAAAQAEVEAIKAELKGQLTSRLGIPDDASMETLESAVNNQRVLRNTEQRSAGFKYGP